MSKSFVERMKGGEVISLLDTLVIDGKEPVRISALFYERLGQTNFQCDVLYPDERGFLHRRGQEVCNALFADRIEYLGQIMNDLDILSLEKTEFSNGLPKVKAEKILRDETGNAYFLEVLVVKEAGNKGFSTRAIRLSDKEGQRAAIRNHSLGCTISAGPNSVPDSINFDENRIESTEKSEVQGIKRMCQRMAEKLNGSFICPDQAQQQIYSHASSAIVALGDKLEQAVVDCLTALNVAVDLGHNNGVKRR